jgi:hypothetical protein
MIQRILELHNTPNGVSALAEIERRVRYTRHTVGSVSNPEVRYDIDPVRESGDGTQQGTKCLALKDVGWECDEQRFLGYESHCTGTMVPSQAPPDGVETTIQQYLSSNYCISTYVA